MTLGQKLKKLRTDKGLTQKDLAEQLHVTFQTVSKREVHRSQRRKHRFDLSAMKRRKVLQGSDPASD